MCVSFLCSCPDLEVWKVGYWWQKHISGRDTASREAGRGPRPCGGRHLVTLRGTAGSTEGSGGMLAGPDSSPWLALSRVLLVLCSGEITLLTHWHSPPGILLLARYIHSSPCHKVCHILLSRFPCCFTMLPPPTQTYFLFFLLSFSAALGMEPRATRVLGKCSTTELHPQPCRFL